jgi:hypothetical protein
MQAAENIDKLLELIGIRLWDIASISHHACYPRNRTDRQRPRPSVLSRSRYSADSSSMGYISVAGALE